MSPPNSQDSLPIPNNTVKATKTSKKDEDDERGGLGSFLFDRVAKRSEPKREGEKREVILGDAYT